MSRASADELALHKRLLAQDPIATSEAIEAYLQPLTRALLGLKDAGPDTHLAESAAIDALVSYVERPEQYNPEKSALLTYLRMAARGDLANAMAREYRLDRRSLTLDTDSGVELLPALRYRSAEDEATERLGLDLPEGFDARTAMNLINEEIPDARDRRLFALMADGERKTTVYAAVLGIEHLPVPEQQRQVKQHKDRLGQRVRRLRGRLKVAPERDRGDER